MVDNVPPKRKRRMVWWKAALVNLVALAGAAGFTVVMVRQWLARREQLRWPTATATITSYKQGPGFKGRDFTYLVGHYPSASEAVEFSVVWAPSDFRDSRWVPPDGVPTIGSTLPVHVDEARPTVVALERGPRVVTTARSFVTMALVDVTVVAVCIAVWLM